MGKFYGESEGHIRKLFEEAHAHAPAIIFIDEIDAIAPKREDMDGIEEEEYNRREDELLNLLENIRKEKLNK